MCTSPVYSSRKTFCISQCVFEGEPTLMRMGFKVTISLAAVVSHTEQEYSRPMDLQWSCSSLWSSKLSSKNSRCSP